ncbi:MAG TPA: HemK2/MTQ2 family protein methyltransferase [Candidatus Nanoarchaeia archaeon]|nr:HemK2/MTQ2 family protein methyltransferase [Candidatus Nanoarchaeia archaeon]
MDIYQPAEDSYLLQKFVRQFAIGRVLDMGTGSGIQGLTAIEVPSVREVVAVDSNPTAVEALNAEIEKKKLRKIKARQGNLFEHLEGSFNVIIFNPPYLPQDKGIEDAALYGGKKGWEISERFFKDASSHMFPEGVILFLFSSLTKKQKIEEILEHNLLQWEELDEEKIAFETLYVYKITKTPLLRQLEGKLLRNVHYFAEGKRGIVYTAQFDKSLVIKKQVPVKKRTITVAIKVKKKESKAADAITSEVFWLKALNERAIGPKMLFSGEDYVAYEFAEGVYIEEWLAQASKENIQAVLKSVFQQCYVMDKLQVNKEEMHHPLKHIIVDQEANATLIDFERCYESEKPHNVTQFADFVGKQRPLLVKKGFKFELKELREAAAEYKEKYAAKEFEKILGLVK